MHYDEICTLYRNESKNFNELRFVMNVLFQPEFVLLLVICIPQEHFKQQHLASANSLMRVMEKMLQSPPHCRSCNHAIQ